MIKQLLISITAVLPLLAQIPPAGNAFQQDGWLRVPAPSGAASIRSAMDGQSGPVLGKPLSASEVRRTEQTLSDGSHISHSETEHFYRDSMGRMRTETSTGAVIFDPVAGFTYELTTGRKTYAKHPVSPDAVVTIAVAAHRSSTSSHSGQGKQKPGTGPVTEDLPPQFFNGIYVKGARVTTIIPAGSLGNDRDLKVINERWYSDDLKLLLKSSNSDPRFGITTYELTDISQTSPDPALFQVPADYSPSNVIEGIELRGARGIPPDALKAAVRSKVGDIYDEEALRRDFTALWNTGRFEDVRMEKEQGAHGGTVVRFILTQRP